MFMKNSVKTIVLIGALLPSLALAHENKIPAAQDRISFYQAQLVCPAAPLIGCGSAAKPILLELERDPHVSEAWLDRPGTNIAVVWKERMASRKRAKIVQAVLSEPKVHELKGEARATIKQLRRVTPESWLLTQHNPPAGQKHDFSLPLREWRWAHRVVGKYSRQ